MFTTVEKIEAKTQENCGLIKLRIKFMFEQKALISPYKP